MREMKDSGVEWIGEIPKQWKICRLKNYAHIMNGSDYKEVEDDDGDYPVIGSGGEFARSNAYLYKGESVLLGRKGTVDKPRYINGAFWTVDTMYYTEIQPICLPKYLYYLCTQIQFDYYQYGSAVPSMTQRDLNSVFFPFPTMKEQKRIVDFLDFKCSKIDAIIEKQEAIIEKLKEYKLSMITEAVTKGLNPDADMKDSGAEWIGKVPSSWKLSKAKYYVKITNGSDPKTEGDIPVYGSGSKSFRTCGEYKEGPCVLLGRKGATLHIPHYVKERYWNVDTAFDVKTNHQLSLKYYFYLANCFDYKQYISQTTLPGMTQSNYGNMIIPIPSISEQERIVSYIENKKLNINKEILRREAIKDKLQEYKKSLIYEVVTGKKEV